MGQVVPVHQPICISWIWVRSLRPTRREQTCAPRDCLSQRARRQLLRQKSFVAIASATLIYILNSSYNLFLNNNHYERNNINDS